VAERGVKPIAENRRARHDYHLLDHYEAGLQLTGTEVKSLRDGRVTLGQAYADLRDGEVWLIGAHIDEYAQGNVANHEPERDMYFKDGRVKLELAVGRGKEQRDKRRDIAKRDAQRDIERALRRRR
jgi:SsrA-binding protein